MESDDGRLLLLLQRATAQTYFRRVSLYVSHCSSHVT